MPTEVEDSILKSTKKTLSLPADYDVFDEDVILHINSVFMTLNQIGIGPDDGFEITGETEEWSDYLKGNKNLNAVKSYMYLRVRLLHDPPSTSFAIDSMQKQIDQLEWRLNIVAEEARRNG